MALPHAQPGEVISLHDPSPSGTGTRTLFRTPAAEGLRLVLPRGKTIAAHKAPGELIVQCLSGRVRFTALGRPIDLEAGQMFYLSSAEPHAVEALDDCVLLVTILFPASPAK